MATESEFIKKCQAMGLQAVVPVPVGSLITAHPRENHVTATVLTTATMVAIHQPNRVFFMAVNCDATNHGFLSVTEQVATTRGWRVAAAGGSVQFRFLEDLELTTLSFWAINTTAQATWWFLELLADQSLMR